MKIESRKYDHKYWIYYLFDNVDNLSSFFDREHVNKNLKNMEYNVLIRNIFANYSKIRNRERGFLLYKSVFDMYNDIKRFHHIHIKQNIPNVFYYCMKMEKITTYPYLFYTTRSGVDFYTLSDELFLMLRFNNNNVIEFLNRI